MTRSRLTNVYFKNQNTVTGWSNCKYQRVFYTNLLQKTNFDYFC